MPYIIGIGSTSFGKHPNRSFRDLAKEAVQGAMSDAQHIHAPQSIYFGNCAMHAFGQANIRGQTVLGPLFQDGLLQKNAPITNIEAGCATGGASFHAALQSLHQNDFSMAVGVEKLLFPDDPKMLKSFPLFADGIDRQHKEEWMAFYQEQSNKHDLPFSPHPYRIIFLDIHAMQAHSSIRKGSCTKENIAQVASKNHNNSVHNPRAQYRFPMTTQQVLQDRDIIAPFTRSMCAPVSDGAAAVLLCSDSAFARLPPSIQKRSIQILGCAMAGGSMRDHKEVSVTFHAGQKAFSQAAITPQQINIAEVHDSTAHCELKHMESLQLCETAGPLIQEGTTQRTGALPVNASGGLISKGHPLGATGIGQLFELTTQLRGEGGDIQVKNMPSYALAHNAGGMVGFDEALSVVSILKRASS